MPIKSFQGQQERKVKSKAKTLLVEDIMSRNLIIFKPNETIHEVMSKFIKYRISGGPVVNENGDLIGESIFFKKKPSFKNALVQSIAGGNTMIFNNKAAEMLNDIKIERNIISHDWLLYQLVSGSDGNMKYSKNPSVLYRQHSKNLIGSNVGFKNKIKRLRMLLSGEMNKYNKSTLQHLSDCRSLSKRNLDVLKDFEKSLHGNFLKRFFYILRSGIYRQTIAGQFMLIVNLFIKNSKHK